MSNQLLTALFECYFLRQVSKYSHILSYIRQAKVGLSNRLLRDLPFPLFLAILFQHSTFILAFIHLFVCSFLRLLPVIQSLGCLVSGPAISCFLCLFVQSFISQYRYVCSVVCSHIKLTHLFGQSSSVFSFVRSFVYFLAYLKTDIEW